jgi:hypothetical protein
VNARQRRGDEVWPVQFQHLRIGRIGDDLATPGACSSMVAMIPRDRPLSQTRASRGVFGWVVLISATFHFYRERTPKNAICSECRRFRCCL